MGKNEPTISELIDAYGEVSKTIKTLEETKQNLKERISSITGDKEGTYDATMFNLTISKSVSYEYSVDKTAKLLGPKKFLSVVKVMKGLLDTVLSPVDQNKLVSKETITTKYSTSPKGGK